MTRNITEYARRAIAKIRQQIEQINSQKEEINRLKAALDESEAERKQQKFTSEFYKEQHDNDQQAIGFMTNMLNKKQKEIEELKEVQQDLEKKMEESDVEVAKIVVSYSNAKEQLKQEQEEAELFRNSNLQMMKLQIKVKIDKKGELFGWQVCEICVEPFSTEKEHTPRVLACGHTICFGCLRRFHKEDIVKCPFDRLETVMGGDSIETMPKNFAILNMCC